MGVAASADRLNLEKNGVNVAMTEPEQTSVRGGVSAAAAVPSLRARLNCDLHLRCYLYLAHLLPAPNSLPLAKATVQVPALTRGPQNESDISPLSTRTRWILVNCRTKL